MPRYLHWRASAIPAAAVSMALLLESCATPHYVRPQITVPPAYRGEGTTGISSGAGASAAGSFGELKWQAIFQDEELSRLIQEALTNNLDPQIAAARVLEARAQFAVSRSARLPSTDVSGLNLSGWANGTDLAAANLYVNLGWELDLWGRVRNTSAAARSALLASEEARHAVLQALVSDLACAYFLLRDLDLEIEITRRTLKSREDSLNLIQLRVDNGYSSEIDLRQAEVLVKGARTALVGLELQSERTENQISTLLGRNPGAIVRGRSLLEQGLSLRLPPGLPSTLLNHRPDIRQAEQQLIGDQAMVAVARAAFFPTISLTGSTGFASSALIDILKGGAGAWSFGPVGNLPVFNSGAIRAGVRGAEARRLQSLLAYQKTVQQAFREVSDSLAGYRKLSELRMEQEGFVESLRQGVELADLAYKGGIVSYLEYLDSERQLLDAELQLVQIRRLELCNIVVLYRSLGGGWQ